MFLETESLPRAFWVDIKILIWKKDGVKLNNAATPEIIADTQSKLEFIFPEDFINFYKKANGFIEWDIIGNMFSIWSLEKIVQQYKIGGAKKKFLFPFATIVLIYTGSVI